MYIRIKKQRLSPRNGKAADYALRFLVVQSHRSDGAPRQRIIRYPGSVKQKTVMNAIERSRILNLMQRKVDTLDPEIGFATVTRLKPNRIRILRCPSFGQ